MSHISDSNDVKPGEHICSFSQKSVRVLKQPHAWPVQVEARLDEVEEGYRRSSFVLVLEQVCWILGQSNQVPIWKIIRSASI